MGDFVREFAMASGPASMRGVQVLSHRDLDRLEALFLGLDFDQRQRYFGGGISDASLREHCRAIHWGKTTVIARSAGPDLDAVAIMTAGDRPRIASLEIACAPARGRPSIIANLLELALTVASLSYSHLTIDRHRAPEELLVLLGRRTSNICADDVVRIPVPSCSASIIAC